MTTHATMVEKAIRNNFSGADGVPITDDMDLRADLGGHDLDLLQAVMDLEDALEIEISDEEDEALRTVGDLKRLVASKLGVDA